MTFSRAQHGAHRERVCPWDLSRDEFCGSVYFFAPIGKFETQRHRATESFGNQTQGCRVLLVDHSVIGGEFRLICIFPTCSPCPLWLCVSNVRALVFHWRERISGNIAEFLTRKCQLRGRKAIYSMEGVIV